MDHKFTEKIKQWLETPEAERDYSVGATYLLKLSGNQIMYKNIIRCIDSRKQFVEYQLQKYYNFCVAALTREQVAEMSAQVETIAEEHHLTDDDSTTAEDDPRVLGIEPIPNINEKISLMIEKYRRETIDIEDVEFEEYDLEFDSLFSAKAERQADNPDPKQDETEKGE